MSVLDGRKESRERGPVTNTLNVVVDRDELRIDDVTISFQRTLRIPESGLHSLPPGLGRFPLRRVEDYPDTAPREWLAKGGVILPIYQREAMWLAFGSDDGGSSGVPCALQIGVGKVCAVSGEAWDEQLSVQPQNYVALPAQPWLDGINSGNGEIRQFVAVPLGLDASVEAQVTGEEVHGGIQLRAVPLTAAARQELDKQRAEECVRVLTLDGLSDGPDLMACAPPVGAAMGLGAGGRMKQEVYEDDRPVADYDESCAQRVFVHLCSAAQWTAITGEVPPPTPVDREWYVRAGLPWFDYYDADAHDVAPSAKLAVVKPVGEVLKDDSKPFTPIDPKVVVTLKGATGGVVADGSW